MSLERVDYFWGLFQRPERAAASAARKRVSLQAPKIPPDVQASFMTERIAELDGDYGTPAAGDPTEIDSLEFCADGATRHVRIVNRGITLFRAETPELLRLHRFCCVLQNHA